jgi:ribosomal protein S27E
MGGSDRMKVSQIRQDRFVEEYLRLHVNDVEQVLMHKDEFIEIPCPACEQEEHVCKFKKSGFNFVECSACGTLFISPRPTPSLLSEFYRSARSFSIFNEKIYPASEAARRDLIFSPRAVRVVELCKRHLSNSAGALVDVGAGFGTFCEEVEKLAFFKKVIAVEPSPALAETCRSKGLNVFEKPIEEVDFEDHISVTVCFELIEHLFGPKEFLLTVGRKTSCGGLLILTTPNIEGFDLKVLGPLSENVDGAEHLN